MDPQTTRSRYGVVAVAAAVVGALLAWLVAAAAWCPDCIPTKTPEPFMIRGEIGTGWLPNSVCLAKGPNYAPLQYDSVSVTGPNALLPFWQRTVTVPSGTGDWAAGPFEYAGQYVIAVSAPTAGLPVCGPLVIAVPSYQLGDVVGVNFGYQ